jgi:hypothetical protein
MNLVGYALIPANADLVSTHPETFKGRIVRVLEFSKDSNGTIDGCLCINGEATAIADVRTKPKHYFECSLFGSYITPPNISELDKMIYVNRLIAKNIDSDTWRIAIVANSMSYNKYTDNDLIK